MSVTNSQENNSKVAVTREGWRCRLVLGFVGRGFLSYLHKSSREGECEYVVFAGSRPDARRNHQIHLQRQTAVPLHGLFYL